MNADILDRVNFESRALQTFDDKRKRTACIGAGEIYSPMNPPQTSDS